MVVPLMLALAVASPTATPSAAPQPPKTAAIGPVLVGGKSTYGISLSSAVSQSATATQNGAPAGTYFTATPGTLCIGSVTVTGDGRQTPGNAITSSGQFTFTRTGSPLGCAITITSSAGGASATVLFQ